MVNRSIRMSTVILLVSGIGVIFSLPALHNDNFAPWLAFKLFFFVGFLLLVFKR